MTALPDPPASDPPAAGPGAHPLRARRRPPARGAGARRGHAVRRRELERHRRRLHLRRPRHVQASAGCGSSRATSRVAARPARVRPGRAARRLAAGLPGPGRAGPAGRGAAAGHPAEGGHGRRRPPGDPAPRPAEALRDAARADAVRPAHRRRAAARRAARPGAAGRPAGGPRPGPGAARRVDGAPPTTVTAVVVDDVLVDVEPGDTTERLFGIAFDLGTTTVVATLLDLATGTPVAVASLLNPQQPYGADVITRISATMMDPDALGRLTALAHEGLDQLAGEVCADGGVDRARGLRDRAGRQRHDDPPRAGHRPRAAGRRPVRHGVPVLRRPRRRRPRRRRAPAGPGVRVPRSRRLRRRRHRRGRARVGDGPRPADPAVHRHRHELRDPAGRRRPPARDGGARRAGVRGRGHPLRDARRPGRGRGREDQRRGRAAAGHRRRRPGRPGRFRARRRRRGHGRGRPRRRLGAVGRRRRRRGAARARRAVAAGRPGAGVRAAHLAGAEPATTRPTGSTCPSATSASCSSPRRRSRRAGRCCWRSRG